MDERLLGEWELIDGDARASVTRFDTTSYSIMYVDSVGQSGAFIGRLGRVGELLVLDVEPAPEEIERASQADFLLLSGHVPIRIRIEEESLWTSSLDTEALANALASGDIDLPYEGGKIENVVIHGTHDMLVRELFPYLQRPDAWEEEARWKRHPDDPMRR